MKSLTYLNFVLVLGFSESTSNMFYLVYSLFYPDFTPSPQNSQEYLYNAILFRI